MARAFCCRLRYPNSIQGDIISSSLLALLDDIATVLDDVAILTKVAAGKTAGLLGDDLALNAEQVSGVRADRELPVVWGVAKGSAGNKLILIPAALLLSAFLPGLIGPLLMLGGAFLCFEGFDKVAQRVLQPRSADAALKEVVEALHDPNLNLADFEAQKIRGAIRTDFVLSAEIIVIALGTVQDAGIAVQASVVTAVGVMMTIGVYGFVALIVKIDDIGYHLVETAEEDEGSTLRMKLGQFLLLFAPDLMKSLTVIGTVAMFLVGGGIIAHGIGPLSAILEHWAESAAHIPTGATLVPLLASGVFGIVFGALIAPFVAAAEEIVESFKKPSTEGQ